jgi:hypothetical protein
MPRLRLRRIPEGLETPDGRFAVEYRSRRDTPQMRRTPWTATWCAVNRLTGEVVPKAQQAEARRVVERWTSEAQARPREPLAERLERYGEMGLTLEEQLDEEGIGWGPGDDGYNPGDPPDETPCPKCDGLGRWGDDIPCPYCNPEGR